MKYISDYFGKTARVLAYIGVLAFTSCSHPLKQASDLSFMVRGQEGREMIRFSSNPQEIDKEDSLEKKFYE